MALKKGQMVRLKRGNKHQTARIQSFFGDIVGGVLLDRDLDGFCCWNVNDLEPVRKKRANRAAQYRGQRA